MEVSDDHLLGGRVAFRQPKAGYRAGVDAALLAAACDAAPGERVLDVGCGAGAVMLVAARRRPEVRFVGLERDADAAALARANVAANGWENRVDAHVADVVRPFRGLGLDRFDAVMANPPFFDDRAAIRGPAPAKSPAWIADAGLGRWLAFLLEAVRARGAITLIHRADRLADILAGLAPQCGSFQIRPVHPFADAAAKRVLVRAVASGRAPLRLLPAVILHQRDGRKHTPAAETILRGEADLPWD
ncbi:MAG: methyltransferase [Caulobacteraceae bacterium]|nr:methyltransferase [Caulobacteraceae bacterium]